MNKKYKIELEMRGTETELDFAKAKFELYLATLKNMETVEVKEFVHFKELWDTVFFWRKKRRFENG